MCKSLLPSPGILSSGYITTSLKQHKKENSRNCSQSFKKLIRALETTTTRNDTINKNKVFTTVISTKKSKPYLQTKGKAKDIGGGQQAHNSLLLGSRKRQNEDDVAIRIANIHTPLRVAFQERCLGKVLTWLDILKIATLLTVQTKQSSLDLEG
ncbi:hypothetical protein GOBAR_AA13888 [Gossypium barbadense]|uniref:Uncharacterized protein n=1 Tax=Gossypium barbadense TaxID=3634 RepID=A0A2P5XTR3_GOSBA|nr:hypothetical protein GOBAR_AA13888 [Gossypium barbadense]